MIVAISDDMWYLAIAFINIDELPKIMDKSRSGVAGRRALGLPNRGLRRSMARGWFIYRGKSLSDSIQRAVDIIISQRP